MGFICMITCKTTGKSYVGKTIRTIEVRWKEHKANAAKFIEARAKGLPLGRSKGSHLYSAMALYGVDDFEVKELERDVPLDELDSLEAEYIVTHDLMSVGYNLTCGGEGGHCTEETKRRMSRAHQEIAEENRIPELKGLPPRISRTTTAEYGDALRLSNHPLCKSRWFFSASTGHSKPPRWLLRSS